MERRTIEEPPAEWERLKADLEEAQEQLREKQATADEEVGSEEAALFEAQATMLDDPELIDQVRSAIEDEHLNAEAAIHDAAEHYAAILDEMEDEYISTRAADVRSAQGGEGRSASHRGSWRRL